MVAQAALQLHGSTIDDQVGDGAQAESMTTVTDNNSLGTKDRPDNSLTPKRKSLFYYSEPSQGAPKKMRIDIMNEINEEIMLFLKDPRYETDLIFYKKTHFPRLHRLALRTLCVPATSAPSERIFSRSGLLMRPHRNRLSKDMLSKLTFIKCNLDLLN
jgi:hypothetical protein